MSGEGTKAYMHFYNAMPFSFGEGGRVKWIPGRREVGHGALAEKALIPVIPSQEEFPYTILLMSEIMSQNGSTSMASTVGSTMALMDAGVPIKRPVAGIAMGVVTGESDEDYKILTDIQGVEDFYGDMDFKVTGTTDGITAIQMDNKAAGLPIAVFKDAIAGALKSRLQIIEDIKKLMGDGKKELSKFAPKVARVKIPTDKIGELIGPGGKNIRDISERLEVELDVEEDGTVNIFSDNQENLDKAKAEVESISFIPEIGEIYDGTVESVVEYGAFVEIAPGTSGLLHVSELSDEFVKNVKDFVNEGDVIKVKVLDVDDFGKIKLSLKAVKKEN
jgi:polyribonucleotide nucleotidyltransferase